MRMEGFAFTVAISGFPGVIDASGNCGANEVPVTALMVQKFLPVVDTGAWPNNFFEGGNFGAAAVLDFQRMSVLD